jgi:hypothetical protein
MVKVNPDNSIELELENQRLPLVFVVAGRDEDKAEIIGRTVLVSPRDANALTVAFAAVGEAEQERRGEDV